MTEQETLAFVMASAKAVGIPMDTERAVRVSSHLQRTAAMAQLLEEANLTKFDEPAEIYCPKPH